MTISLWYGLVSGAGAFLAVVLGGVFVQHFLED